jgi:signal transduction histidine kinase
VSEALTNTAKHAHASAVHITVDARDDVLELWIRDDGCGGADPTRGSGLLAWIRGRAVLVERRVNEESAF